ncbi:MAG: ABC transporter ATP-binding protein/permease [Pseudomonadota bacterium]|nr:ABC transporter ATP-binding protein/permease [Pseudomonadota bacterium]
MTPAPASAFATLFRAMSPQRRRQLTWLVALAPFAALAEMLTIGAVVPLLAFLGNLSDLNDVGGMRHLLEIGRLVGLDERRDMAVAAAILFASAAFMAAALRLLLMWSSQRFSFGLGHELAVEIQRRVLAQPYPYHVGQNSSAIISSLEKVEALVFGVILPLVQAATATIISLFIVAILLSIDALSAAAAAGLVLALYGAAVLVIRPRLARDSAVVGAAYEQRVKAVQEGLGGIRDIIIDHKQAMFVDLFRTIDERLMRARTSTAILAAAPRFIIEAFGLVAITALALIIADREGGLAGSLPVLGALALGAQRLLPLTQQLYQGWSRLAGSRSLVDQVAELLRLPIPETHAESFDGPVMEFTDAIRFEGVGFRYAARRESALFDIDLVIPHGARVALVGRTGSGKSTLADLLMGLLQPETGRITIDGVALTGATARAWQRGIAHVPQAIFLADTTIARNIAFGEAGGDRERVIDAARLAQLDAFIDQLPGGYDTAVGERGVRLSGGQRQRLGLARAIYKGAPVLVLDEATSALDDVTEAAVMGALDELAAEGRTIVIVAHRRSTIARCDLVIRLEEGRIVERG